MGLLHKCTLQVLFVIMELVIDNNGYYKSLDLPLQSYVLHLDTLEEKSAKPAYSIR